MRHYYREIAEIADKLIELGFEFDGLNRMAKNGFGVIFRQEWIIISGTNEGIPLLRREFMFSDYRVGSIAQAIVAQIKEILPKSHLNAQSKV